MCKIEAHSNKRWRKWLILSERKWPGGPYPQNVFTKDIYLGHHACLSKFSARSGWKWRLRRLTKQVAQQLMWLNKTLRCQLKFHDRWTLTSFSRSRSRSQHHFDVLDFTTDGYHHTKIQLPSTLSLFPDETHTHTHTHKLGILISPGHTLQWTRIIAIPVDRGWGGVRISLRYPFRDIPLAQAPISAMIWKRIGVQLSLSASVRMYNKIMPSCAFFYNFVCTKWNSTVKWVATKVVLLLRLLMLPMWWK